MKIDIAYRNGKMLTIESGEIEFHERGNLTQWKAILRNVEEINFINFINQKELEEYSFLTYDDGLFEGKASIEDIEKGTVTLLGSGSLTKK